MANKNAGTIVFLVIAIIFAARTGLLDNLFPQAVGGDVTSEQPQIIEVCDSTTTPAVTFNAHNKYSGVSVTSDIKYKVAPYLGKDANGNQMWGEYDGVQTTTGGTAIAVSPFDKIIHITGAANYHNVSSEFITPCKEVVARSLDMVAFDTTLNYTYLKNVDDSANTNAAQQSITAGQNRKIRARIESGNDVGGDYYMVIQYNNSEYSKVSVPELGNSIPTPSHFTVESTGYQTVTYNLGELADNGGKDFTFLVEALTSKDPSTDLQVSIFSRDYFIDELDGRAFKYGAVDENNVQIGDQTALGFAVSLS